MPKEGDIVGESESFVNVTRVARIMGFNNSRVYVLKSIIDALEKCEGAYPKTWSYDQRIKSFLVEAKLGSKRRISLSRYSVFPSGLGSMRILSRREGHIFVLKIMHF